VRRFRETYTRAPNNIAALAYDAAGLLLASMKARGQADPELIRAGLAATEDYPGVTGTIGYAGGGNPVKSALILQITSGKVVLNRQVNP
jgi:branched-chain amino acid transport system substrate-binding protein